MSVQPVPQGEVIQARIHGLRGVNVILDSDLAALYEVATGQLVRAMKRNAERFPSDFAFQLTREEWEGLLCQIGRASAQGGRRTLPWAFTEQGVAMLSGVLRSSRAVAVNVAVMRAFVAMRHELAAHAELARRLDAVEQALGGLEGETDRRFEAVFDALRALLDQPAPARKPIGFTAPVGADGMQPYARRARRRPRMNHPRAMLESHRP